VRAHSCRQGRRVRDGEVARRNRKHTIALTARGGHLTILKLLRENGATFDEWSCLSAAAAGRLDALQWLRANGTVRVRLRVDARFRRETRPHEGLGLVATRGGRESIDEA
jgi:hypothetical protein